MSSAVQKTMDTYVTPSKDGRQEIAVRRHVHRYEGTVHPRGNAAISGFDDVKGETFRLRQST